MKKFFIKSSIILLFIIIICVLILKLYNINSIKNIESDEIEKLSDNLEITMETYYAKDNVIKIELIASYKNGVKSLYCYNNDFAIYGKNKNKIAMDLDVTQDGIYKFKAEGNDGTVIEKEITIDDSFRDDLVGIEVRTNSQFGCLIDVDIDFPSRDITAKQIVNTFRLSESEEWITYTDIKSFSAYDILKYVNSNNEMTVYTRQYDELGYEIICNKVINMDGVLIEELGMTPNDVGNWVKIVDEQCNYTTLQEVFDDEVLYENLLNDDTAMKYIINDVGDILNGIMADSSAFNKFANNELSIMYACSNSNARLALYNNASTTQSELANSTIAKDAIKQFAVLKTAVSGTDRNFVTIYSGKCFILGISQNTWSSALPISKCYHLNINGSVRELGYAGNFYDANNSGNKYALNVFASSISFSVLDHYWGGAASTRSYSLLMPI